MTRKNWIYVLQPAERMNVVLSFFTFFLVKPVYKHRQTHTIKELLTKFIRMLCCKRCHVLDSWRTYWKQGNHHDKSLKEMWSRLLEAMELWKSSIGPLFFVISSCQCLALPGIKKCLALPSDDWQCKMPKLCWLKVFWGTKLYLSEQGLTELGFSKFGVRAPLPWSLNSIILKGW